MNKLEQDGNKYFVSHKKSFAGLLNLNEVASKVFDFAYGMTFGLSGEHRNHRTGGNARRKNGELFTNTFQGKLAEFGVYMYFKQRGIDTKVPDLGMWELGKWDDADLEYNGLKINIKSAAFFSNLLLLESGDWDNEGRYIPNIGSGNEYYDFFILCRISPDLKKIMTTNKLFYSNEVNKKTLEDIILSQSWQFDIAGFITKEELVTLIKDGFILPQGAILNVYTNMDAKNYYCQSGDMHQIDEIISLLKNH